jgi:hypothetical protein
LIVSPLYFSSIVSFWITSPTTIFEATSLPDVTCPKSA